MQSSASVASARDRLILAVDTSSIEEARRMHDELREHVGIFKIGLQLLTRYGPEALKDFQAAGSKIFLDAKFHDIPNTVAKASQEATLPAVAMFTIHATGGTAMMRAAVEGSAQQAIKLDLPKPTILAVSVLTSISQAVLNSELQVSGSVQDHVVHLAKLAVESGIGGLVASPEELKLLRHSLAQLNKSLTIVTPGVRPSWAEANDQSRFTTPSEAIANGADFLVVGRPISQAKSPKEAAQRVCEEIESALAKS